MSSLTRQFALVMLLEAGRPTDYHFNCVERPSALQGTQHRGVTASQPSFGLDGLEAVVPCPLRSRTHSEWPLNQLKLIQGSVVPTWVLVMLTSVLLMTPFTLTSVRKLEDVTGAAT